MDNHDAPLFDLREAASDLFPTLDEMGLPFRTGTLEIGDCLPSLDCAIEIKRVSHKSNDLRESLFDGRMNTQAEARRDNFRLSILIIQTEKGAHPFGRGFTRATWETIKWNLKYDWNCHLESTHSTKETIDLIYNIWDHLKRGKRFMTAVNKTKVPLTLKEKQIRLLSGLRDCGKKKATELINDWQTPMATFNWICREDTPHKFQIEGFGPEFFKKNQQLLVGK